MKSLMGDLSSAAKASIGAPPELVAAIAEARPEEKDLVQRARQFAAPLLARQKLESGEPVMDHADAVAIILQKTGGSVTMQAACWLVHACSQLARPHEVIAQAFDDNLASLAVETTKLVRVERQARSSGLGGDGHAVTAAQSENLRKMLLAFSRDLRVIMLRLASRLQTLRWCTETKSPVSQARAWDTLYIYAPLAHRLGIWQIKWELEDLSFRLLEPQTYRDIARRLDETRIEREIYLERLRLHIVSELKKLGISANVQGRPKHIYSIAKKMRGKSLDFDQVYDIYALRAIVPTVQDCYAVLSWIHERYTPIPEEFDDYIAKPKLNGYQSLHTVVRDENGKPVEIQIRTQEMHDKAEHGVAAHWAYKEAGAKGYGGVLANSDYDAKIAVLRQLLAWGEDLSGEQTSQNLFEDRIYVLTPNAAIIELPRGATPVDFAYSVHTSVGHRCRGARVDNVMVPLNTPLQNGQTVEIITTKEGGPSKDWLISGQNYLTSHRARAKVRAWFNAQVTHETIARGREAVEKVLQREGKTAFKLDDLASGLGFTSTDALFELVGKDEYSLRNIESLLREDGASAPEEDEAPLVKKARGSEHPPRGGILVVGIDSLLTQLASCCKPAPPDPIGGFVTKGKGVSIHRSGCHNFRQISARNPDRVIEVKWNQPDKDAGNGVYPVDIIITAADRQGLLRDISEVFTREKINVIGVQTQSTRDTARMVFTVEISDLDKLHYALGSVAAIRGVRSAQRR